MKCPVCDYENTEKVIVDLFICDRCSHIYKENGKMPESIICKLGVADMRLDFLARFRAGGKMYYCGPENESFINVGKEKFAWDIDNKDMVGEKFYDVIAFCNSLEFNKYPTDFLDFCTNIALKDDGIILIELPTMNFSNLEVTPSEFYNGKQCQYFCQTSILEMLKRAKLKIIDQYNYWNGKIGNTILLAAKEDYADKYIERSIKALFG